jgi:heat shock protein HtpX
MTQGGDKPMKLYFRSLLLILALYGLVFAVGDAYLSRHGAPVWAALAFAVGFIGLQYWLGPNVIQLLCAERGLKMPRIGIIESATPNAFTYGRVPSDARVVVTTGLLEILTPEEANTVLAHEMGHVEHYDFIVMTLAALAPPLLYQLYTFTRGSDKARPVAAGAYLAYWVSQYIVLILSRTREYFADQYSARVTRAPDALAGALVKIAYGIFQADGELATRLEELGAKEKARIAARTRPRGIDGPIGCLESGCGTIAGVDRRRGGDALGPGESVGAPV